MCFCIKNGKTIDDDDGKTVISVTTDVNRFVNCLNIALVISLFADRTRLLTTAPDDIYTISIRCGAC